ncbi:MAG: Hpt domain-containing protein [Flavobacteriales bacterium]|nr:Hpt domain-containing protein [Flavobacteriales bacterium]
MLRLALIVLVLVIVTGTTAQSRSARNDPQRPTKAAVSAELARIDSAGDAARSIDARIRIAELLKSKDALILLQDAAARADSADDTWLGIEARDKLMALYRANGDNKRALAEAMRIIELERISSAKENEREELEAADMIRAHQQERDSLLALLESESSASRNALGEARKTIAQRELTIITTGAIGIILLLITILVLRRSHRRVMEQLRTEIGAIQARIADMAGEMKELVEQYDAQRTAPPATPSSEAPAPIAGQGAPSLDPMVLAIFKRQAPERIAALETAREANDHEKVLRVLHSLRPQLDALDPDGLGASCARLRAMQPSDADRDAGLDRLIAGMHAMMAHR